MRFMMLMYPGAQAEEGVLPDEEIMAAMMAYNEELTKAGVLLALDGLQPSSQGARVRFPAGKPAVTDGPFTESKELIGGYWLIDVRSKEEAVEWASRCPARGDEMIEVRRVYELADFAIDPDSALGAQTERVASELERREGGAA